MLLLTISAHRCEEAATSEFAHLWTDDVNLVRNPRDWEWATSSCLADLSGSPWFAVSISV